MDSRSSSKNTLLLETIVEERGEETLVQSEVTVVEVMAVERKNENSRGTEKGN
jgi:hypothetical protein